MSMRRWFRRKNAASAPPPEADDSASFDWEFEGDALVERAIVLPPVALRRPPAGDGAVDSEAAAVVNPSQSPFIEIEGEVGGQISTPSRPQEAAKYEGESGARRTRYIRYLLDGALERWWSFGEIAPPALLREGLLLLESGHALEEAHRSLLLRTALYYRKGLLTALRHQSDPERAALLIKEALVDWEPPLPPERVAWLRAHDPLSVRWEAALLRELQTEATVEDARRRGLASAALVCLQGATVGAPPAGSGGSIHDRRTRFTPLVRAGLLVALVAAGLLWWLTTMNRTPAMVEAPAGEFVVRDPTAQDEERMVRLDGFLIDRFEVTNRDYRRCYERGACPWPVTANSATRVNYLVDTAFDQFPVVNMTWAAAAAYCTWAGKRLPTAEEWEVAAGYAPATNRRYIYPWGDQFDRQRTNSREQGVGDTTAVGSYRPAGDSSIGGSDMAGNVAEWTSSWVRSTLVSDDVAGYVIKGGSFEADAAGVAVTSQTVRPPDDAATSVGFRCARTLPVR
jgi:formylglycine-generating enzyme required for sulfatase activity